MCRILTRNKFAANPTFQQWVILKAKKTKLPVAFSDIFTCIALEICLPT